MPPQKSPVSSQISIELFTYHLLCYAEENLVQQSPSSISSDTKGNAKVERSVDDDDFLGADGNGIRKKKGRQRCFEGGKKTCRGGFTQLPLSTKGFLTFLCFPQNRMLNRFSNRIEQKEGMTTKNGNFQSKIQMDIFFKKTCVEFLRACRTKILSDKLVFQPDFGKKQTRLQSRICTHCCVQGHKSVNAS